MVATLRTIDREDWARKLGAIGYRSTQDPAIDFATEDGRFVIVVLERPRVAVRDLRAVFLRLAAFAARHTHIERACIVFAIDRLTPGRMRAEWGDLMTVLRPDVARCLGLVAVGEKAVPPGRRHPARRDR